MEKETRDKVDLIISHHIPADGWFKLKEIVAGILDDPATADDYSFGDMRRRWWHGEVRRWLGSLNDRKQVNGESELVPRFTHYPDGKSGDRWLRTEAMSRGQLGSKIAMLRHQQRGYDVRLRVYEHIYELLPDDDSIIGEVLR